MTKQRRWYDKNPYVSSLLFMLQGLPRNVQTDVSNKILKFTEKFKESYKDRTVIDTARTPQILGLYQSTKKRRWYDKDPLVSKAVNNIAILSNAHYKTLVSQLFPSIHKFYLSSGQGTLKDKIDEYIEIQSKKPPKKEVAKSDVLLHEFGFDNLSDIATDPHGTYFEEYEEYEEFTTTVNQYGRNESEFTEISALSEKDLPIESPLISQNLEDIDMPEESPVVELPEAAEELEKVEDFDPSHQKIQKRVFSKKFDAIIIKTVEKKKQDND